MTDQHPYPTRIVEAVAKGINPEAFAERLGRHPDDIRYAQSRAMQRAEGALSALWEVDSPTRVSATEASTIWEHAVAARNGNVEAMHTLRATLAAHAPDWGDHK